MARACSYYIERRRFQQSPAENFHRHDLSPRLLGFIHAEPLADAAVLDLGCGAGRLTLALAPDVKRVIGVDWSEEAIEAARELAADQGLTNCDFRIADVERLEYRDLYEAPGAASCLDMVVANLCMSDTMIHSAAAALRPAGCICFAAFHCDQWQETGRPSRFAYDEERAGRVLEDAGFNLESMVVEQEIVAFDSAQVAFEQYFARGSLMQRWRQDGRLSGLQHYFAAGGRSFTAKSHLIVKARVKARRAAERGD